MTWFNNGLIFIARDLPWLAGIIFGLFVLIGWSRPRRQLLSRQLAHAAILALGASAWIKWWWPAARPFAAAPLVSTLLRYPSGFDSFPSAHTALFVALAVVVWRHSRRWGGGLLVIALSIGLARVLTGLHWPSDVAAGIIVGLLAAGLATRYTYLQ